MKIRRPLFQRPTSRIRNIASPKAAMVIEHELRHVLQRLKIDPQRQMIPSWTAMSKYDRGSFSHFAVMNRKLRANHLDK
jgi:hypothetical protein